MPPSSSEQLKLETDTRASSQLAGRRRNESSPSPKPSLRLAVSPDEAAAALGVSRDYFDEHVISELRIVRRGRRILVSLAELERWLDRSAARVGRTG
jgi:excisionase family DNA binding protein